MKLLPATRLEDEIYNQVIANLPGGDFLLKANYVQPNWKGLGEVQLVVTGLDSTSGSWLGVWVNNQFKGKFPANASVIYFKLQLDKAPTLNLVSVKNESTGEVASTTIVVTTYGSVHWAASAVYYRNIYLRYLKEEWALLGEWNARISKWMHRYNALFPNTQALATLATRLSSRSCATSQPSTEGVTNMVQALTCGYPVVTPTVNQAGLHWATSRLWPKAAEPAGFEFDVWMPDLATAREVALVKLCDNLGHLGGFREGVVATDLWSDFDQLYKDPDQGSLVVLLNLIGPMDTWMSWVELTSNVDLFSSWWMVSPDNTVEPDSLGLQALLDTGEDIEDKPLDVGEVWAHLWNGVTLASMDQPSSMDSVIQDAVGQSSTVRDPLVLEEWEISELTLTCVFPDSISNTLHGGAPPSFSA